MQYVSSSSQGTAKKPLGRDWKRRYPRYRVDLPIRVTVLQESGYHEVRGRCGDIGLGGVGTVLSEEVPKGEVVDVQITLRGGDMLAVRAIVRFRKGLLHGLEFLTLSPEQRSTVESMCHGSAEMP